MDAGLKTGLTYEFRQKISESMTVPALLPEAPEFQAMPHVLATGYMVGLIELACIKAVNPFLDWPAEQTVGIHVNLSHSAATPPGLDVIIRVTLSEVDGRKLLFKIEAHDGIDGICRGTHARFVIYPEKFNRKAQKKLNS